MTEGSTNLYFTDARADARITAANTADLSEGTNLYYTDARADARITNALIDEDNFVSDSATRIPSQQSVKAYVASQISTKDNTDEMTEGTTNLYYTTARWDSAFGTSTTTGLTEGTNLYYTDARADARTAVATATNTTAWEAHSDASEAAAIASAESKDVARASTATSYTDTRETAITTAYQSYADTAETDAVATAATAAQVKVDALESSFTHFHSSVQSVTAAQETDNTSSTTNFTFSELTNARHYALFINRVLMRAAEYSVSGTTVTIVSGILALDDELEVTGFSS